MPRFEVGILALASTTAPEGELARPVADDDLFVTPAQLARANRVVEVHWRSPAGGSPYPEMPGLPRRRHLPPGSLGRLDHRALPADVLAMNVFDMSPAQIRNRLILWARRAALATGPGLQPPARAHGHVEAAPAAAARVPVVPCVSVAAGDVVEMAESNYRYADGPLRLRVVRVRPDLSEWYDGEWVWLEGVEIGPDGRDGAFRPVLARVAALRPEG